MFDSPRFLSTLTGRPGVYQMFDAQGKLIYVGKAKNLKNRVSSYFNSSDKPPKTRALVAKIADIQVSVTTSETEALLLEQSLIKTHRPPYNVLLRDDKSYPYIYLSSKHEFPRLMMLRSKSKRHDGQLFGPYTSGLAVKDSLSYLQKVLQVRQCDDTSFANRSRPCLQYQIKRCKAPCVGYVSREEYAQDVADTVDILKGKSTHITDRLEEQMLAYSAALEFEAAGECRDKISALRHLQQRQSVDLQQGDSDIVALAMTAGSVCVQVLSVRAGAVRDSNSFFPKVGAAQSDSEILEQFLAQFYIANRPDIPSSVIVSADIDAKAISEAVTQTIGRQFHILHSVRGDRQRWLDLAIRSAEENLTQRMHAKHVFLRKLIALRESLSIDDIKRVECFDISHSSGEATVASCVVFDERGPVRSEYRAYNINDITGGDDYAAMHQALYRRYSKALEENRALPDLLLIDGGKGQMKQALDVFRELSIQSVSVVGVAKGPTRKAGLETLYIGEEYDEISLLPHEPALHAIQQVRDEAHNHAVRSHRKRRDKARVTSSLEGIEGIGEAKRRALLQHFGGLAKVKSASLEDLQAVKGISQKLAQKVYEYFHSN